jgi:acyl-CoA synthetase (AMP-forming)/AMP-acid ligase II
MSSLRTMAWLADPPASRGIRFARDAESWEFVSYMTLSGQASRAAGAFQAAGIRRGSHVGLIYATGPQFVAALLGLWELGATPCPVAPPGGILRGSRYTEHVSALVRTAGMQAVAVATEYAPALSEALAPAAVPVLTDLEGPPVSPGLDGPATAALIQFSSGSTSRPKGIVLTPEGLSAHTDAIARWLRMSADTPLASWVPLHHDMGLIGCLLTPMGLATDIWLMRPEQFLRQPLTWLRCFGEHGAMISGATSSGLDYTARRVQSEDLEGMDFRHWQALVVGAERVRPDALRCFRDLLAPFGFRYSAIVPAYGMAEATLAVTGDGIDEDPRTLHVDADQLVFGKHVLTGTAGPALEITSCGRPLPGTSVRVLDADGRRLPEGCLGEIEICSSTMAAGYVENGLTPATRFGGRLRTGDAGFAADGNLYVIGRIGDSLNIRGQRVFAEDLEQVLHCNLAIPVEPVILLGSHAGKDLAVVLLEHGDSEDAGQAARALLPYLPGVAVEVWRTPRRAILRTTSGKARRRRMWQAFEEQSMPGRQLWPMRAETSIPGATASSAGFADRIN